MPSISMKGDQQTKLAEGALFITVNGLGGDFDVVEATFERTHDVVGTFITPVAEIYTPSVIPSFLFGDGTTAKRPDYAATDMGEFRLWNTIHQEVESNACIAKRGSTTPT